MGDVNIFGLLLMPISQVVSWYLVLVRSKQDLVVLYDSVWKIAAFYCCWALVNKYLGGDSGELGHISMGILTIASYLKNRIGSIIGTIIVFLNYCAAVYIVTVVFEGTTIDKAISMKGSDKSIAIIWIYIFELYVFSNLCLWLTVLYKFIKLQPQQALYAQVE